MNNATIDLTVSPDLMIICLLRYIRNVDSGKNVCGPQNSQSLLNVKTPI